MKKYIIGMTSLLALAACSNEELVGGADIQTPAEDKEVSNIASQMVGDYDMLDEEDIDTGAKVKASRAGIDNDLNATWTVGDELSITNGTLMYSYNVDAVTNEGKSCTFTVVDGKAAHTSTNPDDAFYAIYPRRAVTEANGAGSWKGAVVKGQIFAQQSYAENMGKAKNGNNFGGYYITTDKANISNTDDGTNLSFSFTPLASIVDVNLSSVTLEGDQIAAVYLRDLSNKTIAANFSYDCSSKKLMTTGDGGCAYNYSSRSNVVEVNFFESENADGKVTYSTIGSDKIVRFYILPVKLENGVEITIRTINGHYYTKKATTSVGDTEGCPFNSTDGDMASLVKPFYKKYNFGAIGTARKGAWMGCIPNNIFYTMLSIPGAHDAATSSVTSFTSTSKCQSWTIQQQLENGVRAFDLRPGATDSNLEIKHGSVGTGVTLADAVATMKNYLKNNPTECVLAFIHQEAPTEILGFGGASDSDKATWSNKVYGITSQAVTDGYALNALNGDTKFVDCRGKIIFVYRDDLTGDNDKKTYNACKIPWNDNIARTVNVQGNNGAAINGFLVSYQDIYNTDGAGTVTGNVAYDDLAQKAGISSESAKVMLVKKFIDSASGTTDARLILNFASWAGSTNSTVSDHASNIMKEVNPYIVSKHERLGILFSDYVDQTYGGYNFVAVTLANNFKHVFTKRCRVDVLKTYSKNGTGVDVSSDEYADDTQVYAKGQRF